jgi:hypothetical protein
MNSDFDRDELTPVERHAYTSLPREAALPEGLEERTVALLRQKGQLPTPITAARGIGRRYLSPAWIAGIAAAAVAVFASGVVAGQILGQRSAMQIVAAGRAGNATEAADRVQRAGRVYVAALSTLAQLSESASPAVQDSVRRVALRILSDAAQEMALLAPDDPLAAAVLRGLNQQSRDQSPAAPSRSVVWY